MTLSLALLLGSHAHLLNLNRSDALRRQVGGVGRGSLT